jgi:hypothetical protein
LFAPRDIYAIDEPTGGLRVALQAIRTGDWRTGLRADGGGVAVLYDDTDRAQQELVLPVLPGERAAPREPTHADGLVSGYEGFGRWLLVRFKRPSDDRLTLVLFDLTDGDEVFRRSGVYEGFLWPY